MHTTFWLQNPKKNPHFGNLGLGDKIILKNIYDIYDKYCAGRINSVSFTVLKHIRRVLRQWRGQEVVNVLT
jgi:hypothetical protein